MGGMLGVRRFSRAATLALVAVGVLGVGCGKDAGPSAGGDTGAGRSGSAEASGGAGATGVSGRGGSSPGGSVGQSPTAGCQQPPARPGVWAEIVPPPGQTGFQVTDAYSPTEDDPTSPATSTYRVCGRPESCAGTRAAGRSSSRLPRRAAGRPASTAPGRQICGPPRGRRSSIATRRAGARRTAGGWR